MHDIVAVEYLESFNNLGKIGESNTFRKCSFVFEELFECTSVAKLIDEVEVVSSFEHIEVLDDVLARFEIGEDVDLIVGAFL